MVDIGGVATYPTIVRDDSALRHAINTAAHEWLHAYWIFRSLGWNMFSSPDMNTLNETAADLAGKELGDRAYESITGPKIDGSHPPDPFHSAGRRTLSRQRSWTKEGSSSAERCE